MNLAWYLMAAVQRLWFSRPLAPLPTPPTLELARALTRKKARILRRASGSAGTRCSAASWVAACVLVSDVLELLVRWHPGVDAKHGAAGCCRRERLRIIWQVEQLLEVLNTVRHLARELAQYGRALRNWQFDQPDPLPR